MSRRYAAPMAERVTIDGVEWWTADAVSEETGERRQTFSAYVARGQAPKPGMTIGRTPLWEAKAIRAWVKTRPGRGARTDLRKP